MTELKPCPFCGHVPVNEDLINQGYDNPQWWIECTNVHCPVTPGCGDSCRDTVRQRWNTRADGWIPVSERMPEENERVLVFSPTYKETSTMRYRIIDGFFVKLCTDVTHWQPLPAPTTK